MGCPNCGAPWTGHIAPCGGTTAREWYEYEEHRLAIVGTKAEKEVTALREQVKSAGDRAIEEHEARLCPEDVGCEELIGSLRSKLAAAEKERDEARDQLGDEVQAHLNEAQKLAAALTREGAMRDALRETRDELKVFNDAAGGCDHSVGICGCGTVAILDQVDALLSKGDDS